MSKNTNLSFLTDYITADITNGRIGINNASPTVAFDVVGATKITGALTLTSTISNGTFAYTLPSATGTLALTSDLSSYLPLTGGTLTGALSGTSATFSNLITVSGFGNSTFSAGGTGYNKLTIRNTTAGTGNGAQLSIGTNADADQFYVQSFATTFTTSGMNIAGGAVVNGEGPGGLSIAATQSNIGFYTNGAGAANLRMTIASAGNVGIGTASPVTLDSGGVNLQIKDRSALFQLAAVNSTYLSNNIYYDGSWKRIVSGYGTLIRLTDDCNGFNFLTTGTGAADSAVTFTSAMNITNAGISCFASTLYAPTIQTTTLQGKSYSVTSCSGNVSIVDTGIGIPNNATYLVSFGGNPAAAGGVYSWNEVGFLIINSQYNGSSNTQLIKYTSMAGGSISVYPGSLALYPSLLVSGTEYTQTTSNQPSGQIRLKFCGWSNSTGASQFVYLTQLQ